MDPKVSSALSSAANGELSKYELQVLGEHYPDLSNVFLLIDDMQDREEDAEEVAKRLADGDSSARKAAIERIEGHRMDLSGHLDSLDSGLDELEDDTLKPSDFISDCREWLSEMRNCVNHIETECDEAPE